MGLAVAAAQVAKQGKPRPQHISGSAAILQSFSEMQENKS